MRPDDILDGELAPSAPPSLSLVLDLLRRHVKARGQEDTDRTAGRARGARCSSPSSPSEDDLHTSVERAIATMVAKDADARRKIRQLSQEGPALRRTIAALEAQEKRLDDRLTGLRLDIERGEKEAAVLAEQLRTQVVEFRGLAEAAAHCRRETRNVATRKADEADDRCDRRERCERCERCDRSEGFDDRNVNVPLTNHREENWIRYAFAAAAASSHASIHSL